MDEWDRYAWDGFLYHLLEDEIIEVTEERPYVYSGDKTVPGMGWYFIRSEHLNRMGISQFVHEIYLYVRRDQLYICVGASRDPDAENVVRQITDFLAEYGSELHEMEYGLLPTFSNYCGYTVLRIPYDIRNYKELFQYGEKIMDRLLAEFRCVQR